MNPQFIAIEGVIGVGKTTLTRLLKPYFQATALLEVFEENPFLADFYADRQRYAFQTQLFFLLSRYQQQMQTVPQALAQGNVLADYTFAKDELFAWLNLKDDELAMYGRVHSALSDKIQRPHLLVYLHADHNAVMQRIALRDRPYERDMDPEYIRQLSSAYEAWIASLTDIPVLILDMTHRDVITNQDDLEFVYRQIANALDQNKQKQSIYPPSSSPTAKSSFINRNTLNNYQALWQSLGTQGRSEQNSVRHYLQLVNTMGKLSQLLPQTGLTRKTEPNPISKNNKESITNHLAGMLSRIFQLANDFDIDLENSYNKKIDGMLQQQRQDSSQ